MIIYGLSSLDAMSIRVVELFAGVGGFRLGFERANSELDSEMYRVVWANQWEPSTKKQHAAEVYVRNWKFKTGAKGEHHYVNEDSSDEFVNHDISSIDAEDVPAHDLLCGGFPCQDYSVAKGLDKSKGLEGKKGVLWWEIYRLASFHRPKYLLLENVDRLLKSPTKQRGRDFAVMLASLAELGYNAEWRVINAADYGFPQKRKRVFIVAYNNTEIDVREEANYAYETLFLNGILARAFPLKKNQLLFGMPKVIIKKKSTDDLADISSEFNLTGNASTKSPFQNGGIMVNGSVYTYSVEPDFDGDKEFLESVLESSPNISEEFILTPESLVKENGWIYLKGSKKEKRKTSAGFEYNYSEGPVTFPDDVSKPSRTIITGEGGSGTSRFKHVIKYEPTLKQINDLSLNSKECKKVREKLGLKESEWLRRLTPIELERLNGFPDNHTEGATNAKRAFFMGNALVVGLIQRIGIEIGLQAT